MLSKSIQLSPRHQQDCKSCIFSCQDIENIVITDTWHRLLQNQAVDEIVLTHNSSLEFTLECQCSSVTCMRYAKRQHAWLQYSLVSVNECI